MEKQSGNFNAKEKKQSLFQHLDYAISLSREKSGKETASNADRQKWLRILISAVDSYGKLLETIQLDEITERLDETERLLGVKKQ